MQIKRRSSLTGEVNTKEINVTPAQIAAWEGGELAQNLLAGRGYYVIRKRMFTHLYVVS